MCLICLKGLSGVFVFPSPIPIVFNVSLFVLVVFDIRSPVSEYVFDNHENGNRGGLPSDLVCFHPTILHTDADVQWTSDDTAGLSTG